MTRTIRFFFDFASPYAYFSIRRLEGIAAKRGCVIVWTPILLWAVRTHFGMTPPMEDGPKAAYLTADTERSAAFHGVEFTMPDSFGKSSHLAARLFYGLGEGERQVPYAKAVFAAHFTENMDIANPEILALIAQRAGISQSECADLTAAQVSKDALARAVQEAIDSEVWGSPFFTLDGEGFFGADRLPQLDWRLASRAGGGGDK